MFVHRHIAVQNKEDFVKCARLWSDRRQPDPLSYPQSQRAIMRDGFFLQLGIAAVCSMSDRSRLVLPNVTIPKVRSAWVCSRYQRRATWQI
jgi:hypothetical protein